MIHTTDSPTCFGVSRAAAEVSEAEGVAQDFAAGRAEVLAELSQPAPHPCVYHALRTLASFKNFF